MDAILLKGATMRLLVTGQTYNATTGVLGDLDGSATVTATVLDRATQGAIVGQSWPVTLTYIAGSSPGAFHAALSASLVVTHLQTVDVQVDINDGTNKLRAPILRALVLEDRI